MQIISEVNFQVTPEGHRAPLAELLRRSVNTQTPHDLSHTAHSSGKYINYKFKFSIIPIHSKMFHKKYSFEHGNYLEFGNYYFSCCAGLTSDIQRSHRRPS